MALEYIDEMDKLTLRALKMLTKEPLHELQSSPFIEVDRLVRLGYATRAPFTSRRRTGKIDECWEVRITPAGRAAFTASSLPAE